MSDATTFLSKLSIKHIEILLMSENISKEVFTDIENKETYKYIEIQSDGSILLGKTKYKFINRLFSLEKEITFQDFALRAMKGISVSTDKNKKTIVNGLTEDIVNQSVFKKKYDYVVDKLYDAARYASNDKVLSTLTGTETTEQVHKRIVQASGSIPIYAPGDGKEILRLKLKLDGYEFTC